MARWFRVYDDAVDDPKVQRLPPRLFKAWFNLLCLASQNDGFIPHPSDVAFKLRISGEQADDILGELEERNLLDVSEGRYRPHNWDGRQHQSDISTPRVRRFRERKMKRDETVSETPPDTETEADTEQNRDKHPSGVSGGRVATRPAREQAFEEFWKSYPKRKGANPKTPARNQFDVAVKAGADPPAIVAAIRNGTGFDKDKIGTEFIPQAVKWLRDKRWLDAGPPTGPPPDERKPVGWQPGMPTHEELLNKYRDDDARDQKPDSSGLFQEGNGLHREVA